MLQYHFNWKTLSAIAGVSWWRFYFRLFPGTTRSPQVVEFLQHLRRHVRGKLLIIWDGLRQHRSRMIRDFVDELGGLIHLEYLPACAPELNPVEYIWGHWKIHELPNFCAKDFAQLTGHARRTLARMPRRPTLVAAFWKQAKLFHGDALSLV